jgi:glycosyltransferase involved in cell wall biosynthesis
MLDPALVLLEALAVRGAAKVAVLSEFSRDLLLARHPEARNRIVLVRGGVEIDEPAHGDADRVRGHYRIPGDRPFLLTVRRLEPRTGVEELLRATDVLVTGGTDVTVGIAGGGAMEHELKELALELGLGERVRFLGRVPDADLPGLYATSDLFVLPTVAYEGFGMSTIEALAAGTPVVGTAVGATPEILRPLDERLLSPSASPSDLAATIAGALAATSPDLRRRCVEYAEAEYRWERAIEPWLDALESTGSGARLEGP